MKIAVMGAGAIGGYFGGRLADAGHDITFIARGEHLAAMQAGGLKVSSPLGDFSVNPVRATDDPGAVGVVDLIMFMVKNYDTEAAAEQARPMVGKDTTVVSFQNGVDAYDLLSQAYGAAHVMGGVALIPASVTAPGVVSHNGDLAKLVFGEFGPLGVGQQATSARAEAFAQALASAGVDHQIHPDIEAMLWTKFMFLASMSALNCMTRLPKGPIMDDADSRALYVDAVREVAAVALARGVNLPNSAVDDSLALVDRMPASLKSSMQQDMERGKRLEVARLSGTVARMGAELGVPTPIHRTAYAVLKPYAEGAIS